MCPNFMALPFKMTEIIANNGKIEKGSKINTGPYGEVPEKIKKLKIGLRHDLR